MSSHNLGIYSYEEKLNEDEDDEYRSEESEETESDTESEVSEQEDLARTQQLRLQERFLVLERTLNNLRHQLREEREMWRREVDEISSYCNGKCHEAPSDLSSRMSQDGMRNSTISLDLEPKASYASESYSEKKAALQRQIAHSNFQRRLLEVENMCNLELLRVKQSAQFLEPLRVIASEWSKDNENFATGGHANAGAVEEKTVKQEEVKKPKDVADAVELIGSKLYNEINDMFNKVAPSTWQTSSEESTVSNSSSSGTYISDVSQNSSNWNCTICDIVTE